MKGAIFQGAGNPISIDDIPDPETGPSEVKIRIERCGICGSDISMTSGSPFDYPRGRHLGHEAAGEVIETGREVTSIKVGDKVAVMPIGACGSCNHCLNDRPIYCPNKIQLAGGFAERMVLPVYSALRMPSSMSFADGALVEPMACGRKALRVAGMRKHDTLLVIGSGNMALSIVYWARLQGAGRIVVTSRSTKRTDIAMAMGADATINLDPNDTPEIARTLRNPPDIVAECVGAPGLLRRAVDMVGRGGRVLSMGMCSTPDTIIPALGNFRDVALHFPLAYSREDLIETIRAFDSGRVRPSDMVSTTIGLFELPGVIEEMRGAHKHTKVQVAPAAPFAREI